MGKKVDKNDNQGLNGYWVAFPVDSAAQKARCEDLEPRIEFPTCVMQDTV